MNTKLLAQDDPRVLDPQARVHQGVQQLEDGRPFRQVVLADGRTTLLVDADDGRTFKLSDGSFEQGTQHVICVERDGSEHRAGAAFDA